MPSLIFSERYLFRNGAYAAAFTRPLSLIYSLAPLSRPGRRSIRE